MGPLWAHLIAPHFLYTFLTREKSNSSDRRIIVDLSWPIGNSVNNACKGDTYESVDFILSLPTIDHVVRAVKKFGRASYIAKLDISRAFKQVPIDPRDIDLLGLFWGAYYIENKLVFGFRNGSALYQRLSDSIRFIMTSEGHYCLDYIDDYLIFGSKSDCQSGFDRLGCLLEELGLEVSHHKTITPSTQVICLGILVDTTNFTLSIPDKKLSEIRSIIALWKDKTYCSKTQLQSLLGSLLYISKCVRYSRCFLNRILHTLRCHSDKKSIPLDEEFHKDIAWFSKFMVNFNGTTFFDKPDIQFETFLDASLTGIGGVCGRDIYHHTIPLFLRNSPIVVLEMFNILVATRLWAFNWANKNILIHCDNEAVVTILNSGKSKDLTLSRISRNIFMQCASHDIHLKIKHVPGKNNNIADLLSRWQVTDNPKQKLSLLLPDFNTISVAQHHVTIDDSI